MSDTRPFVLIVEDDFVDAELVRRGVKSRGLDFDLHPVSDGSEALEFLRSQDFISADRERLIIFLDINMPGMNGHQFLSELRADEELRRTIVFVLTTSDHPKDLSLAYDQNVAGYFLKSNLSGLLDAVSVYAEHVEFPPIGASSSPGRMER